MPSLISSLRVLLFICHMWFLNQSRNILIHQIWSRLFELKRFNGISVSNSKIAATGFRHLTFLFFKTFVPEVCTGRAARRPGPARSNRAVKFSSKKRAGPGRKVAGPGLFPAKNLVFQKLVIYIL